MSPSSKIRRKVLYLTILVICCVILGIWLDFMEAERQNSRFYLSESFLFSSFWWLFLPILYGQFVFERAYKSKSSTPLLVLIPGLIHLFVFPVLVWLLSYSFYDHTFPYAQTFQFGLTAHLFTILIVYTLPLVLFRTIKSREIIKDQVPAMASKAVALASVLVNDGNRHLSIETKDILYISANPPYVTISHTHKDYLCNESLKSISAKLIGGDFIQIHKSVIVNISQVRSYRSRLNGDYDLTMNTGTELRLSRTFAKAFKAWFKEGHRDSV